MILELQAAGSRLPSLVLWPMLAIFLVILSLSFYVLYNLMLHPLRKYPGPKLWAAIRIPHSMMILRGNPHREILSLHQRYNADIIRISPNGLSFLHPDAWKDIMGHRKGKAEENGKDHTEEGNKEILFSDRENHSRFRRILANGFSAKSMQDQEPIILSYIDLLIKRLHGIASRGPVDVVAWYNYTTFDIIGDLAFGEPFGCLDNSEYHPWVRLIFERIKMLMLFNVANSYKGVGPLLKMFVPKSLIKSGLAHMELVREKVNKRVSLGMSRPDFAEAMLKKKEEEAMTEEEIHENSNVLIIAGSETTATALSGATYLLTTNPDVLAKLAHEVRSEFATEEEINIKSTARLEYLQAVLEETLRMYPPVPSALPRLTPPSGQEVMGQWVPGNTSLAVWHWAMYHTEKNFAKPFEFRPERWLGDAEFANDRGDALMPFHTGPRNCIGMNLAYAEMRIILSRIIWNFDLQLAPESRNWIDHPVFVLRHKPGLMVHLTPRKSG
ncbi:isotrichodermin C-15 hydroxylase [Colletotrichum higginsianum]|nr:isotrichodermin C-15 hydroxylase [Colletotrichum higginsianum]